MGADISTLFNARNAPSGDTDWDLSFLNPSTSTAPPVARGLIILNQPFSRSLLDILWKACSWHCCADGGANRLYDLLPDELRSSYVPDLIKGDLDSLRVDVREYYSSEGVSVVQDHDQDSTDLMKCVQSIQENEKLESREVGSCSSTLSRDRSIPGYEIVLLGGLGGRLDQTIHTLSYVHKLRKVRKKVFVATDDNISWVLREGQHRIRIDHDILGPTCGLLPVGVDSTVLTTTGLRWNLTEARSSFDGLISTSNHLVPKEKYVTINTSKPIWWCVELSKRD
ncbi:thiamine pyrophosphokinase [Pisolithus croceorrhizus]|nr:thiamine pyrophosphokinase [Pisolithus croceorrhizus]KAI6117246.1 thiamine pyrophosphokinase [Pisolithus croceorrhizus]KAI6169150.1 thiamine pyrophosphokinase [Pisolithus thermaeus]